MLGFIKFLSSVVLGTNMAVIAAQKIPQCGLTCAISTFPESPCKVVSNVTCGCTNPVYIDLFTKCIQQGCTANEITQVNAFGRQTCSANGIHINSTISASGGSRGSKSALPTTSTSSSATTTTTSAVPSPTTNSASTTSNTTTSATPGPTGSPSSGASSIVTLGALWLSMLGVGVVLLV